MGFIGGPPVYRFGDLRVAGSLELNRFDFCVGLDVGFVERVMGVRIDEHTRNRFQGIGVEILGSGEHKYRHKTHFLFIRILFWQLHLILVVIVGSLILLMQKLGA